MNPETPSVKSVKSVDFSPKISVIVPVYKVEKYLPECIESVLAQTFPDFELLLVDDGSPDNSGKICDAYAARDSRIRVFHKPNGGVSSARNLGVKNARADYIAFLDSDDWWKPEFLEKMTSLAQKYPQACCCCCWINFVGNNLQPKRTEGLRGFAYGESAFLNVIEYSAEKGRLPIWTGAVVAKKSAVESLGGFNEELIIYEDYALWVDLCLMNDGCVAYLNEPLSFYRLDSPIENKPRGLHPPLARHWVSHLEKYKCYEETLPHLKLFLDRFKLGVLLPYRGNEAEKEYYNKIFAQIPPESFTLRYWIAYNTPTSASKLLQKLYSKGRKAMSALANGNNTGGRQMSKHGRPRKWLLPIFKRSAPLFRLLFPFITSKNTSRNVSKASGDKPSRTLK